MNIHTLVGNIVVFPFLRRLFPSISLRWNPKSANPSSITGINDLLPTFSKLQRTHMPKMRTRTRKVPLDPVVSLALRSARNKRYYESRKAAKLLLNLATNNQPLVAPTTNPTTNQSQAAPTTNPTTTTKTCQPAPMASLALQKEGNKRYYAYYESCKATRQSCNLATNDKAQPAPMTNPATTTQTKSSTFSPNDSASSATPSLELRRALPPLKRMTTMDATTKCLKIAAAASPRSTTTTPTKQEKKQETHGIRSSNNHHTNQTGEETGNS